MGDLGEAMSDKVAPDCPADLAAVNADLRQQLECEHAVALELLAERDRAVAALERLQQPSLWAESA